MYEFLIFLLFTQALCEIIPQLRCVPYKTANFESEGESECECGTLTDQDSFLPLTFASCDYKNLSRFPHIIGISDINILDLSHNNLVELEQIDTSSGQLLVLNLSYNSIANVKQNFFDAILGIKIIDLRFNRLKAFDSKDIFSSLKNLEKLDLSNNDLVRVPDNFFISLTSLKHLDLSYNPLGNTLRESNSLNIKLGITFNISKLILDNIGLHSQLHNSYYENFTNLKYLSVKDNPLIQVPQTSSTLEYLDLSGTNITSLQAGRLNYYKLKTFKLNRLKYLKSIQKYAFYNLEALDSLEITDCPVLEEIHEFAFGKIQKNSTIDLKKLRISKTGLKKLNGTYKYVFNRLEYLDISFNQWKCDCNILWLHDVSVGFFRSDDIRCAFPDGMENKQILELKPQDLPGCHANIYGKTTHKILLTVLIMIVIILVALACNLCYYSPHWSIKIQNPPLSPTSPYSINGGPFFK